MENTLRKIKIDDTDIFLDDMGENCGKITISNAYGHNYSTYWGSMGGDLSDFLLRINSDYFTNAMLGHLSGKEMDVKKTFTTVRKYIVNEIGLPWYKHQEFQYDMRRILNRFQQGCEDINSDHYFVDNFFNSFVNRLDFYLIENRRDREELKSAFEGITEHWYFIENKPNQNAIYLNKLHKKLQKHLKNKKV
jgi:hypothetical protein